MFSKNKKDQPAPKPGKVGQLETQAGKLHDQATALEEAAKRLEEEQNAAAAYFRELGENPEKSYAKLRGIKRTRLALAGTGLALTLSLTANFTDLDERATNYLKTKFDDAVSAIQDLTGAQLDTGSTQKTAIDQAVLEALTKG